MDKSLPLRFLSVFILYPLIVFLIYQGPWTVLLLTALIAIGAMVEWFRLILKAKTLPQSVSFLLIGNAYIFIGCFLFWFLSTQLTWIELVILLTLIFLSDSGGFIIGNLIGGPKLFPRISPNKTWAGAIGALLFTLIGGYLIKTQSYFEITNIKIFLSWPFLILLSLFAQLGDLFESWAKRVLLVKDSGSLIPGHGGLLDRIDSVLPVIYFVSFVLLCLNF